MYRDERMINVHYYIILSSLNNEHKMAALSLVFSQISKAYFQQTTRKFQMLISNKQHENFKGLFPTNNTKISEKIVVLTQESDPIGFWILFRGEGNSSVVRAPDSRLKGRGFESLLERRENFLLQGQLSVLTLISVSVPPPCYRSST